MLRRAVVRLAEATATPIGFYLEQTLDELDAWFEAAKKEDQRG